MDHATIDFETYSEAGYVWSDLARKWKSPRGLASAKRGLKATGVRPYVEHPSFEVLCMAYHVPGGKIELWTPGQLIPPTLEYHVALGRPVEAHNASFEWTVWNYYMSVRHGWPLLRISQLHCTRARSQAHGLPASLGDLSEVLHLIAGKNPDGTRLIKLFSIPRNPTIANPATRIEVKDKPEDQQKLYAYCVSDVAAEIELSSKVPALSAFERAVWVMDQRINARGVRVDVKAVNDCVTIFEQTQQEHEARFIALTGNRPSEVARFAAWLNGRGIPTPDGLDAEQLDAIAANCELDGKAFEAIAIRQMLSSASVKKLYSMLAAVSSENRLCNLYNYHGAHIGRWTAGGIQPHNLFKGQWNKPELVEQGLKAIATGSSEYVQYKHGNPIAAINNVVRSLFVASPGNALYSSDYSAIEAVVLAVLAGEQWRIDVFKTHGRIYEASASRLTGIPFEEIIAHRAATGAHHPARARGKVADLASGYGSWIEGWKRFGASEFYTNDDDIKQAILKWRAASPAIVEFWGGQTRNKFRNAYSELHGLEGCAIRAIRDPGMSYEHRMIYLQVRAQVLYMRLPSGRELAYHNPRLNPSTRPYAESWEEEICYDGYNSNPQKGFKAWGTQKLYSGLLAQNATSGTARDILAHGMLNCEAAGYPIVMHTHDEVICDVPTSVNCSVAKLEACLNDLPFWAQGWPIAARGGWSGPRYGKWEG